MRAAPITATIVAAVAALASSSSEPSSAGAAAEEPSCAAQQVEYALAGSLKLSDTPMGQGDGTYGIGPGRAVLRFEGDRVQMLSYDMQERFTVHAKTLFWSTTVATDASSAATPNACSVAAEGRLDDGVLTWRTPVAGYHTDGTLSCQGSFCGQLGAPPPGRSPLHIGPYAAEFRPFVFSPDMKTFTMASTPAVKTEQPKQTSEVAVSGREVSRRCVDVPACPR